MPRPNATNPTFTFCESKQSNIYHRCIWACLHIYCTTNIKHRQIDETCLHLWNASLEWGWFLRTIWLQSTDNTEWRVTCNTVIMLLYTSFKGRKLCQGKCCKICIPLVAGHGIMRLKWTFNKPNLLYDSEQPPWRSGLCFGFKYKRSRVRIPSGADLFYLFSPQTITDTRFFGSWINCWQIIAKFSVDTFRCPVPSNGWLGEAAASHVITQ